VRQYFLRLDFLKIRLCIRLCVCRGGVLTPAAAFAQTSLIDHLNKEGIVFKKK